MRHGGTLLPEFDDVQATHIVTDPRAKLKNVLEACKAKKLSEIRADIPILKWEWVITGMHSREGKFGHMHQHAALKDRVLYDPGIELIREQQRRAQIARDNAKAQPPRRSEDHDSEGEEEYSRIS